MRSTSSSSDHSRLSTFAAIAGVTRNELWIRTLKGSTATTRPSFNPRPFARPTTANPYGRAVVQVFDLEGHPKATRAYAWSSPIEGSDKRRFFAVLHMGAIKSPADAVRAAIVAEHRERK